MFSMPSLNISITDDQAKCVQATIASGKFTLSSFFQHVLNEYFEGSNSVVKRDFVIFMVFPILFAVFQWIVFMQSGITWVFYSGLLTLGLTMASTYYVIDVYRGNLKGEK